MTKGKAEGLINKQTDNVYPEPFGFYIKSNDFGARDAAFEFHKEKAEHYAAEEFETRIRDFYALHEPVQKIVLTRVTFKTGQCELLVSLNEPNSEVAQSIFIGTLNQSWWTPLDWKTSYISNEQNEILSEIYIVDSIKPIHQ